MKFTIILAILISYNNFLLCQNNPKTVSGYIYNKETGNIVEDVNIVLRNKNIGTISNENGHFKLNNIEQSDEIVFTHIGYKTFTLKVNNIKEPNNLSVFIEPEITSLKEINIVGKKKRTNTYIVDYDFIGTNIVVLEKDIISRKYNLLLLKSLDDTLSVLTLPAHYKPKKIFIDCFGNCQLIGSDTVYQLSTKNSKLSVIYKFDANLFNANVKNCICQTKYYLIFKKEFSNDYYIQYYGISKDSHKINHFIVQNELDKLAETNRYINWLIHNGFKGDIAAMTRFQHEIMSPPSNQPVLLMSNKIYYFNWINNKLEIYDDKLALIQIISIKFKTLKNWKSSFFFDKEKNKVYTLFKFNNSYFIADISTKTGIVGKHIRIPYLFFDKLKINNGSLYLINKSYNGLTFNNLVRISL